MGKTSTIKFKSNWMKLSQLLQNYEINKSFSNDSEPFLSFTTHTDLVFKPKRSSMDSSIVIFEFFRVDLPFDFGVLSFSLLRRQESVSLFHFTHFLNANISEFFLQDSFAQELLRKFIFLKKSIGFFLKN